MFPSRNYMGIERRWFYFLQYIYIYIYLFICTYIKMNFVQISLRISPKIFLTFDLLLIVKLHIERNESSSLDGAFQSTIAFNARITVMYAMFSQSSFSSLLSRRCDVLRTLILLPWNTNNVIILLMMILTIFHWREYFLEKICRRRIWNFKKWKHFSIRHC